MRIKHSTVPSPPSATGSAATSQSGKTAGITSLAISPISTLDSDPLKESFGEMVDAVYARRGETAVLEMAAAAGLPLVKGQPDPSRATSFGVGQMQRPHSREKLPELPPWQSRQSLRWTATP